MNTSDSCPLCGWTLDAAGRCASCDAGRSGNLAVKRAARPTAICPQCQVALPQAGALCPECGGRAELNGTMAPIARIVAVGAAVVVILMIVDLVRAALGS